MAAIILSSRESLSKPSQNLSPLTPSLFAKSPGAHIELGSTNETKPAAAFPVYTEQMKDRILRPSKSLYKPSQNLSPLTSSPFAKSPAAHIELGGSTNNTKPVAAFPLYTEQMNARILRSRKPSPQIFISKPLSTQHQPTLHPFRPLYTIALCQRPSCPHSPRGAPTRPNPQQHYLKQQHRPK